MGELSASTPAPFTQHRQVAPGQPSARGPAPVLVLGGRAALHGLAGLGPSSGAERGEVSPGEASARLGLEPERPRSARGPAGLRAGGKLVCGRLS